MQIYSNSVLNGYLDDSFGKYGDQLIKNTSVCSRSFHLAWDNLPRNTKSLALIFIDHDAIPVCGFSWLHWTVANIDPDLRQLPENSSLDMNLLQGVNSYASSILSEDWRLNRDDAIGYGGCAPPDRDHTYTLELYALDEILNLSNGFYANELINTMVGHILDKEIMRFKYRV